MSLLLIIGCAATTGVAETEAPVAVDADLAEIGAYQGYDGAGEPMESGQSGTVTATNSSDQPLTITFEVRDTSDDASSPDAIGLWNVTTPQREVAPGESVTTDIWYRFLDVNPPGEGVSTDIKTGILSIKALDSSGSVVFEDERELEATVTSINPPD